MDSELCVVKETGVETETERAAGAQVDHTSETDLGHETETDRDPVGGVSQGGSVILYDHLHSEMTY